MSGAERIPAMEQAHVSLSSPMKLAQLTYLHGAEVLEPVVGSRHEVTFWSTCSYGSSPDPPSCALPRRFLRDYDSFFPVAEDISLLQQASSALYPLQLTAPRPD